MPGPQAHAVDPRPPVGWDEIIDYYGDIRHYIREDGTLDPRWEYEKLDYVNLPFSIPLAWDLNRRVTRIRVHRRLCWIYWQAFQDLARQGLQEHIRTYGGSFAYRPQRGSSGKISLHAFGAATDLNPQENPMGSDPTMHPAVVDTFTKYGFTWGGTFRRKDGMHFQWASGW